MLELKDAYTVLGIKEGAGKDEIIKRYNMLLKRYRNNSGSNDAEKEALKLELDEICKAYNLLMGYGNKEPKNEEAVSKNTILSPIFKRTGIDENKVRNFIYYYKFHMLAAVAILLIIGSIVSSIVNYVKPDLNIFIAGEFQVDKYDVLRDSIKSRLPNIKEVQIDTVFLSPTKDAQMDMNMRAKFVAIMAGGDLDVLILDRANFESFGKQGAFASLDSLTGEKGFNKETNSQNLLTEEESNDEHLYGIDVSNSAFLKSFGIQGQEKIAAIRSNTKHYENAVSFMKILVEN